MPPRSPKDLPIVLERSFHNAGQRIISEGDPGVHAFLIQSGTVSIFSEHNGKRIVLGELGPGDIFGEMSLLIDMPRTANVEATSNCILIHITRQILLQKLEKSDPTIRAILSMMMKRVQSGNDSLANKRPTLEDLHENLVLLYEEVLGRLAEDRKHDFREELLPLIEEITEKMNKYKV